MIEFHKRVWIGFILLVLATTGSGVCFSLLFFNSDELLPADKSSIPWHIEIIKDGSADHASTISVVNEIDQIEFNYLLSANQEIPYVKLLLVFDQSQIQSPVDFSHYYKASFKIKCSPHNVLTFNLRTYDDNITKLGDLGSYRFASHWFDCANQWRQEEANLSSLQVPLWWLLDNGASVHDRSYRLDQVFALSFDSSRHGLVGIPATLTISKITLHYYSFEYLVLFAALCCISWVIFANWAFRMHSSYLAKTIRAKIAHEKPFVAYQKLTIESHKDKEKSAVVQFLATNYTNPDLNMETLIQQLGVNRKKINEILKEEMGFTFKAYLNKLRLKEAARLVCQPSDVRINEIAFTVGYKNVTHFNKLFKEEFGCAPNKLKQLNFTADTFSNPK